MKNLVILLALLPLSACGLSQPVLLGINAGIETVPRLIGAAFGGPVTASEEPQPAVAPVNP